MSRARASSTTPVSVYSGRERLGSVDCRGDGFVAINTDGTVIGTFPSLREAIGAFEEAVS